jgi:hydrocephalus-inducing protein
VRTACSCPDVIRDPKHIFTAKKPKGRGEKYALKTYVASRKTFEFGPLLIAAPKAPTNPKDKAAKEAKGDQSATNGPVELKGGVNSDKLHFTNNGLFVAEVNLMFENEKDRNFTVQPDNFSLAVGESIDVKLIAMPDTIGEVRNALIVCVKDNPEPLRLDVSAIGSKPDITIDGKKDSLVDFGRLLLRRSEQRKVTLKNVSALPSRWKLLGAEKLPPELKIDVTAGVLQPGASAELTVTFESERANSFNVPLKMEVGDAEGSAPTETMPFVLKAEAHDVVLEWTKALDFKTVKVGEAKKETIKLLNKGPYEVSYQFRMSKRLAEVLTITPMEGTLRGMQGFKDAMVTQVEVIFRSDKETVIGKKMAELEVSFIEPTLKELVYPVQRIQVLGEALFNKFQIKPLHINFGPCLYKQKKQATFDIVNTGCFDLKYKLFSLKEGLGAKPELAPEVPEKGKKAPPAKPAKGAPVPDLSELVLGAFTVTPSVGTIPIGGSTSVTVSIQPEGNVNFHEVLGIHIDDRDPSTNKDGIPFDLEAESCVPGIIADLDQPESDSVFEEQQIVARLDGFKKQGSAFSRDERVFSFGTSLSGRRLTERFRITNPVKVPCTVHVQILPRGDTADAKAAAEAFDIQGLKAEGGKLQIGPHEHRYVTVGFTPTSLNTFGAMFEATVEGGLDPKTKQLRFELRGDGSLPNVALDVPPPPQKLVEFATQVEVNPKGGKGAKAPATGAAAAKGAKSAADEEKAPPNTLILPRTIVGTKTSRSVTVRNVGDLAATIRFAFPTANNPCFAFPSRNEDIVLQPGALEKFACFFEPTHAGDYQAKLTMTVQDNHYEDAVITVLAEGYHENLVLVDVDENTENRLSLGDCYVGSAKTRSVGLRNHSDNVLRFSITTPNPSFTLSPSIGHIAPGSTKRVDVTYLNNAVATEVAKCTIAYSVIDLAVKGQAGVGQRAGHDAVDLRGQRRRGRHVQPAPDAQGLRARPRAPVHDPARTRRYQRPRRHVHLR